MTIILPGIELIIQSAIATALIPWTPYALHYRTDRMPGYHAATEVDIGLTGETVDENVLAISTEFTVAGQRHTETFEPTPNLRYRTVWDRRDGFGRRVRRLTPGVLRTTYEVQARYASVTDKYRSFGEFAETFEEDGEIVTKNISDKTRNVHKLTLEQQLSLDAWDATGLGFGGWTLDVHHVFDAAAGRLRLGDGTSQAATVEGRVDTIAGGPRALFPDDVTVDLPAEEATLLAPSSVAVAPDGTIYYVNGGRNNRVFEIGVDGVHRTFAGSSTDESGFAGDGGPATDALLDGPSHVAVDSDGRVYITDWGNQRIRRVDADGTITTVAGGGTERDDGILGTDAQLINPVDLAVGPAGDLYFIELAGITAIRRLSTAGILSTIGQSGGKRENGVPAAAFDFHFSRHIDVAPDGTIYVVAGGPLNQVISRIDSSGIVRTVVGSGEVELEPFISADDARLEVVNGFTIDRNGDVLFTHDHRVYRVGEERIVELVAGGEEFGFEDETFARRARFSFPTGLAVTADGNVIVADRGNNRVRTVTFSGTSGSGESDFLVDRTGELVYEFDEAGRHVATLDPIDGNPLLQFEYDDRGHLVAVDDDQGNVTRFERDDGRLTAVVAPFGQRTTVELDERGYLSAITDPAGETAAMKYTAEGLLTGLTTPGGQEFGFNYDEEGRLVRLTDASGESMEFARTRTDTGYNLTVQTGEGREVTYQVERQRTGGPSVAVVTSDGTASTVLEAENGAIEWMAPDGTSQSVTEAPTPRFGVQAPAPDQTSLTTPRGRRLSLTSTRTEETTVVDGFPELVSGAESVVVNERQYRQQFDAATRSFTTTSPEGRVDTEVIDERGRLVSRQTEGVAPTTIEYDVRGRVVRLVDGTDTGMRVTTFGYNETNDVVDMTTAAGDSSSVERDSLGRPLRLTGPDGATVTFGYDADGNLTSITPPASPPSTYEYNANGALMRYVLPDAGAGEDDVTIEYDRDGLPTRITNSDGRIVSHTHDDTGRLTNLSSSDGSVDTTYEYDVGTGQLETIRTTDTNLSFDRDGPLLLGTTWSGAVSGSVTRTFDDDFRVASSTVNSEPPIQIERDNDGFTTRVGDLNLGRDPQNGRLLGTEIGTVRDVREYNDFGEAERYAVFVDDAPTPVFESRRERDQVGRITRLDEVVDGDARTSEYTYDSNGRLVEVSDGETVLTTFAYDEIGNRIRRTDASGTVTAEYDGRNRLRRYGDVLYEHTPLGAVERVIDPDGAETTYRYTPLGVLTGVTTSDGTTVEYAFDGTNRRISRTVNGDITERFVYLDARPLAQLDSSGEVLKRFVYATGQASPDYMTAAGRTYRIIVDHSGSPRLVIDVETGEIVQRLDFELFGRTAQNSAPGFQPFGFAGGITDPVIGSIHFASGEFDPITGRWISRPSLFPASYETNPYVFSNNDPVNLPFGI